MNWRAVSGAIIGAGVGYRRGAAVGAGHGGAVKDLVDMTRDDWNLQVETNVTGAFLHSRSSKGDDGKKSGAIVNIASFAAYFAFPGIAA